MHSISFVDRVKNSNLLRGFMSTTVWGGLSKLLTLLVTFYCSNTLAEEGFGEYSFVKNTLNMILVISATQFSSLATKFATESLQSEISLKRLFILVEFIVGVGVICGITSICMPIDVIQSFTGGNSVAHFVRMMGVLLPAFIIQPIVASIFRGYKQFNRVGIYETLTSLFLLLLTIACTRIWGYYGAIYALLIYYIVNSVVGVVMLWHFNTRTHYIHNATKIHSERYIIWTMVVPVFLMSFVEAPLTWVAQAEMGRRASYAMVGGLSVILSIRYILQILPTYFYQAFIPHATQLFAACNHKAYFLKYRQIGFGLTGIFVIVMPLLTLFGRFLLGLYGASYVDLYPSFVISLIITIIILFSTLLKTNMMIREHQQLILVMTIVSSLFFVMFFYAFLHYDVNILNAYLFAQGVQYGVQLVFGLISYFKDKKLTALAC